MANTITDISGDLRTRMTNARFARVPIPSIFTGWTTLRVACYLLPNSSGANITGTPRFGVGLCAGSTNILGDTTTDHFAGALSTGATWTFAAAPARYAMGTVQPSTRIGTTIVSGTTLASPILHTTALGLFFVDITVGSPNYSLRLFACTNNAAPTPTLADFLAQSVAGTPAFTGHVFAAAQTVAVDEATNGTFDHACVWWNQTNPTMDIAAWRVYRVA